MMKVTQLLRGLALVSMLLVVGVAGCKDKGAATTPPAGEGDDPSAEVAPERTPEKSNRKGTGEGWRWKGERDHCRYLVDKECFKTRPEACAAAGCSGEACYSSDAIPSQVSCDQ